MVEKFKLDSVSDDDLLRRLSEILKASRRVEVDLISHIGEVDRRRLYASEASESMFSYCTERLHLSEQGVFAYRGRTCCTETPGATVDARGRATSLERYRKARAGSHGVQS